MSVLSFDEVRQKTKELLGNDISDFSYLTDDLIEADRTRASAPPHPEKADVGYWLGNNARYGEYNGQQGYWFDWSDADFQCGSQYSTFLDISWHHTYLGRCANNGREAWRFDQ